MVSIVRAPSTHGIVYVPEVSSTVDATDYIEAAIDQVYAKSRGGKIVLPPGRLRLTRRLNLPKETDKFIVLEGQGQASEIFVDTDAEDRAAFYIGSDSLGGTCRTVLRDFTISGDQTYAKAADLEKANGLIVERVRLDTLKTGFVATDSFGCHFHEVFAYSVARRVFDWASGRANGCVWDRCGLFNCGGASYPLWYFATGGRSVIIQNGDYEVVGSVVETDGGFNSFTFAGNFVEQSQSAMFDFTGGVYGAQITGNVFSQGESSEIDNLIAGGEFSKNWLYDQVITWGSGTQNIEIAANRLEGSASLGATNFFTNGDSNVAIPRQAKTAQTTAALTTARTWTLRLAADYAAGTGLTVLDAAGGVTGSNTLTIARGGSDTINGTTTFVLNAARSGVSLVSDGASAWTATQLSA